MTSKRQRRERREEMYASEVYVGPFENEWLIPGPDTMPEPLRDRLHRLLTWAEFARAGWAPREAKSREQWLALDNSRAFHSILKFNYRPELLMPLIGRENVFLQLIDKRH